MARIRYINPEFFTDDRLAELPPLHRIFFAGMWCHADREGRLDDKPKQLKVKILPYDNVNIDIVLKSLVGARLINRYLVNGCNYIEIKNFLKYQKPHHTEKPSSIPSYNGEKTVKYPSIDGEKLAGMGMVNGDGDGERLMGMVNEETPLPPFLKGGVVEVEKSISKKPAFELPDWIPKTDWDDFIEMRKKLRKPPTDRAKRDLVNDLDRLKAQGNDVAKVLEQSIKNSWLGLFPIKTAGKANVRDGKFAFTGLGEKDYEGGKL